jgi:hypothetical protein
MRCSTRRKRIFFPISISSFPELRGLNFSAADFTILLPQLLKIEHDRAARDRLAMREKALQTGTFWHATGTDGLERVLRQRATPHYFRKTWPALSKGALECTLPYAVFLKIQQFQLVVRISGGLRTTMMRTMPTLYYAE